MVNLFRIDNKVAVVIGAGGIGEALVEGLAEYGAKVVIADLNLSRAKSVAKVVQDKYTTSEAVASQCDVTDEDSVTALGRMVVSKFGKVDILVNAFGINVKRIAVEFSVDEWDNLFKTNVRGAMLTCREFGKIMIEKQSGKIINISSVRGLRATFWDGNEGYAATKASVDMITRSLAAEWAPFSINVNAIAPSTIDTRFSEKTLDNPQRLGRYLASCPLGRVGQPLDVVGACIFLSSPASDFITGQIIYLDGGLTAIG